MVKKAFVGAIGNVNCILVDRVDEEEKENIMLKKALLFTASILALFSKAVFAKSIDLHSKTIHHVATTSGTSGGGE